MIEPNGDGKRLKNVIDENRGFERERIQISETVTLRGRISVTTTVLGEIVSVFAKSIFSPFGPATGGISVSRRSWTSSSSSTMQISLPERSGPDGRE